MHRVERILQITLHAHTDKGYAQHACTYLLGFRVKAFLRKSYMRISYDFTRYGRYAFDISQTYECLGGLKECEHWVKKAIEEMGEKTLSMVGTTIESLKSHDAEPARSLSETEKQVDNLYLNELIEKTPATNRCTISSLLVVRYLERIADHATYIGESIVYLQQERK